MLARGFRALRCAWPIASLALVVSMTSCTHMALTAPTKSVIALYASPSPANDGSYNVIATITEDAGTPVQNGTLVTFTTTSGSLAPTSAETTNGQATVKFVPDGSKQATVSAFSGGATSGSGSTAGSAATVKIPPDATAAAAVTIN